MLIKTPSRRPLVNNCLPRIPVRIRIILRALYISCLMAAAPATLSAVPFYWEPKSDEPGFTVDVPSLWSQASRSREKVGNVHFEKKDRGGRVAIEVRSYSAESSDIDQLILQLRTRLAVKYDRVFLVRRKEVGFRKNVEKQIWKARIGKKNFILTTAFVVSDDKVLQLVCVAPAGRQKEYEFVFDNALLSLDFSDGKPDSESGQNEAPAKEPAAAAAPATIPTVTGIPAIPALPAAGKPKPPKIEF